jgi:hypothetical protein
VANIVWYKSESQYLTLVLSLHHNLIAQHSRERDGPTKTAILVRERA